MGSKRSKCVICGKLLGDERTKYRSLFCSDRCKMVDLGRWLGEEYRIPGPFADAEDIASHFREGSAQQGDGPGERNDD